MKNWLRLTFIIGIAIFLIIGSGGLVSATDSTNTTSDEEEVRALVQLAEIESFDSKEDLKQQTKENQRPVVDYLEPLDAVAIERQFWISNSILVTVDTDRMEPDELRSHEEIIAVEVDEKVEIPDPHPSYGTESVPDDPTTYGLEQTNAPDAWETFDTQGEGVTVGVIDEGINPSHVSLELNNGDSTDNYEGAWHTYYYPNGSFTYGEEREGVDAPEPFDSDGHGTHVSGTIAGGNQTGTAIGVAPDVKLIHSVPLYDGEGLGFDIIGSMQWMAEQEPDVVSMSLGSDTPTTSELDEVENLRDLGITVVSSSGNSGEDFIGFPSAYEPVISVGATDSSKNVPSFSSGGAYDLDEYSVTENKSSWEDPQVTPYIVAPGDSVWSASNLDENSLTRLSGTSMAAPHVSGIVALMLANNPDLTPDQIEYVLQEGTTDAVGVPDSRNTRSGYGIANAYSSLALSNPDGYLAVQSIDANESVEYGDTLVVTANVTNANILDDTAKDDVTFLLNDTEIDSKTVELDSEQDQELRFEYETTEEDTDFDEIVIETGDEAESKNVTIAEPAEFDPALNSSELSEPFVVGETVTFNSTVTNVGGVADTGNLSLYVNGTLTHEGDENIPKLNASESADIEFSYTPTESDLPELNITTSTDSNQTEQRVDVVEPATFEPTVNTTATDDLITGENATISVDVENVGGVSGSGDLDLAINESRIIEGDSNIPETEVGEQSTVNFTYKVADEDYPTLNVSAQTPSDKNDILIDVLRPAKSDITVTSVNTPVESEDIETQVEVNNIGDFELNQSVNVEIEDIGSKSSDVELEGENSTTLSLTIPTEVGDHGAYSVNATTPNSSSSLPMTIDRQATFAAETVDINGSVSAGETITADITVENIGDVSDTQIVTLSDVDSDETLDSADITLDSDENTTITLDRETEVEDVGDIEVDIATEHETIKKSVSVTDPNPAEITSVEAKQDIENDTIAINGTVKQGSLPIDDVFFEAEADFTSYSTEKGTNEDVASGGEFSVDIPTEDLVGDGDYTPVVTVVDNTSHEVTANGSSTNVDTTPPEIGLDADSLETEEGDLFISANEAFEITEVDIETDDNDDRSPDTIPTGLNTDTVEIDFDSSQSSTTNYTAFNIIVTAQDENKNSVAETLNVTIEDYEVVDGEGTVEPSASSKIEVRGNQTEIGSQTDRRATVSTSEATPSDTELSSDQISGGFWNVNDIGLSDSELENATISIPIEELDQEAINGFDESELVLLKSEDGESDYKEIQTEYNEETNELVAIVDGFSQFAAGGTDTTPPSVDSTDVSPSTDVKSDDGPVTANFGYSDEQSSIDVSETSITADVESDRYNTSVNSSEGEIIVDDLTEGESIALTLTVTDSAGNEATETVDITVESESEESSNDSSDDNDNSDEKTGSSGSSSSSSSSSSGGGGGGGSGSGIASARPTAEPDDVTTHTRARGVTKTVGNTSVSTPGNFLDEPVIRTVTFDEPDVEAEIEVRDYNTTPDRAGKPPGEIVTANEIMVPYAMRNDNSTLQFDLSRIEDPQVDLNDTDLEKLTIWSESDGEWTALETEMTENSDGTISLEAQTDSYSHMAVTTEGPSEDATKEPNAVESENGSGETNNDTPKETNSDAPGFGLALGIIALVVVVVWVVRIENK